MAAHETHKATQFDSFPKCGHGHNYMPRRTRGLSRNTRPGHSHADVYSNVDTFLCIGKRHETDCTGQHRIKYNFMRCVGAQAARKGMWEGADGATRTRQVIPRIKMLPLTACSGLGEMSNVTTWLMRQSLTKGIGH